MQTCNCCGPERSDNQRVVELELAGDALATELRGMYMYVTSRELQAKITRLTDQWRKVREFGYL